MSEARRGRPPIPKEERRRQRGVPFSPNELESLTAATKVAGVPLAVFIRNAAIKEAVRVFQAQDYK
jgi:hypothetical protein